MYDKTITVFNRYRSALLGTYTWYPKVLHNVDLIVDKTAAQAKTGLENADAARLHVRYTKKGDSIFVDGHEYLEPKEWEMQPNDQYEETMTFSEGNDFFILGEYDQEPIEDDMYRDGLFNYLNNKKTHCYRIKTVGMYFAIPHFEIGGA